MKLTIQAKELLRGLKAVLPAASVDVTRAHLNAVLFKWAPEGGLRLVATDNHILAVWKPSKVVAVETQSKTYQVIAPLVDVERLAASLRGLSGHVEITIADGTVAIAAGSAQITIKGADAMFPPYEQIMPYGARRWVESIGISATLLAKVAKMFDAVKVDRTAYLVVEFQGGLDTMLITSCEAPALTVACAPARVSAEALKMDHAPAIAEPDRLRRKGDPSVCGER